MLKWHGMWLVALLYPLEKESSGTSGVLRHISRATVPRDLSLTPHPSMVLSLDVESSFLGFLTSQTIAAWLSS